MNTCETCFHWKTLDTGIGHGACRKINWEHDGGFEVQSEGKAVIVVASIDDVEEGVDCVMMTLPTFGCTEWQKEEFEPDWTVIDANGGQLTFSLLSRLAMSVNNDEGRVICGRPEMIQRCSELFTRAALDDDVVALIPETLRFWRGVDFVVQHMMDEGTLAFVRGTQGLGEPFDDWRHRTWVSELRGIGV